MTVWRVQVRPCAPCGSEQGRTVLHGELAQGVELAARLGAVRVALAVQDLAQGLVEDVTEAASRACISEKTTPPSSPLPSTW